MGLLKEIEYIHKVILYINFYLLTAYCYLNVLTFESSFLNYLGSKTLKEYIWLVFNQNSYQLIGLLY